MTLTPKTILILGVNGFIGSHLADHILAKTDWTIIGMDLTTDKITAHLNHPRFQFTQGNMLTMQEWIEEKMQMADVLLPLVAVATPATYVNDPLRVFELDFEANLSVIRSACAHKTRVIFPSTSEVYGMSTDIPFDEDTSMLTLGPICKERWIYSCSKQMMDRVIYAMGKHRGLEFTLFRPFNWYGPRLDDVHRTEKGGSRVLTQFIGNILRGEPIHLVGGGTQRRCFTYIDDCMDALLKIIDNQNGCANQGIFNIGNPEEDLSIKELAELLLASFNHFPAYKDKAAKTELIVTSTADYYGKGYQDVDIRVPSIEHARKKLGWSPKTAISEGLMKTLDYYLA